MNCHDRVSRESTNTVLTTVKGLVTAAAWNFCKEVLRLPKALPRLRRTCFLRLIPLLRLCPEAGKYRRDPRQQLASVDR